MSLVKDYLINTFFYITPEAVKTDLNIALFVSWFK
jgi:hypothetical protein